MRFGELVATSERVAGTAGRRDKIDILAGSLSALAPAEVEAAVGFLVGWPRQGRVGVGWAGLRQAMTDLPPAPTESTIDILDVDRLLAQVGATSGRGSAAARAGLIRELLAAATDAERRFLVALTTGEVRQGALEAVVLEAVARAGNVPLDRLERAAMLAGDVGRVAETVLVDGLDGLDRFRIQLFRPLLPMLADSAPDPEAAMARLGTAALEYKIDGARVQVHKDGDRVAVYTRNLNDVTAAVPEVVERVRGYPASRAILDGEVVALDAAGRPRPFQDTMRRFGRKLDVEATRAELPVRPFFFDLLLEGEEELLDRPEAARFERLADLVPAADLIPRIVTAEPSESRAFFERALAAGHEGLMAKAVDAPYAAGRRGSAWLKVKPARTLDLVILAAEWGHGRRQGWLSNVHLGARDPATGGFVMLGKTFKGMTDEMLRWQTARLLELEDRRDGPVVFVRPELVVEVAFDGVQRSSQYPGGVALRFARLRGYRPDKVAADADPIEAVRALI